MSKKLQEPNYEVMLDSAIKGLQAAYNDYKNEVIKNLQASWFDDNGSLTILGGSERRLARIREMKNEVTRLYLKVNDIKEKIEITKIVNNSK